MFKIYIFWTKSIFTFTKLKTTFRLGTSFSKCFRVRKHAVIRKLIQVLSSRLVRVLWYQHFTEHCTTCCCKYSRGNKCQFWQIFVEAHEELPNYFIQSKTSASAHEYSVSNRAGSVTSRRSDRAINWHLFPRLNSSAVDSSHFKECPYSGRITT